MLLSRGWLKDAPTMSWRLMTTEQRQLMKISQNLTWALWMECCTLEVTLIQWQLRLVWRFNCIASHDMLLLFQPSERLGSTLDACISSIVTSSQDIPLIANAISSGTSVNVQAGCPAEQCGMGVFSVTFTTQQSYIGKNVYSSTTTNYNMISFSFQTR